MGICPAQRRIGNHGAERPREVPAQAVVVGQGIEINPRLRGQREMIEILLTEGDGTRHHTRRCGPWVQDLRVVAAAGGVGNGTASGTIEFQIGHQAGLATRQRGSAVISDLARAASRVPQPKIRYFAAKFIGPAFHIAAQTQRRGAVGCHSQVEEVARNRLYAIDVERHLAADAVDDAGRVVPLARLN